MRNRNSAAGRGGGKSDKTIHFQETAIEKEKEVEGDKDNQKTLIDYETDTMERVKTIRYDMKVNVKRSENITEAIVDSIKIIFETLWSIDKSVVIMPWYENNNFLPIKSTRDFPNNQTEIKRYFQ